MTDRFDTSARTLRTLCKDIETGIARGALPPELVTDLKGALDETRTRVWASMKAAQSGDPGWVREFWMHRAAEVCQQMIQRLEQGELDRRSPKAAALHQAAARLVTLLAADSR